MLRNGYTDGEWVSAQCLHRKESLSSAKLRTVSVLELAGPEPAVNRVSVDLHGDPQRIGRISPYSVNWRVLAACGTSAPDTTFYESGPSGPSSSRPG